MRLVSRNEQRSGAVAVEAALLYPLTFLLILGLFVGAIQIFDYEQVAHLSREGARYASVHGGDYASTNASQIAAGTLPNVDSKYLVDSVIKPRASGLNPASLTVTVKINTPTGSFDWDATSSTNNRAPTASGITNTVSVSVQYAWTPGIFWSGPITLKSTAVYPMSF